MPQKQRNRHDMESKRGSCLMREAIKGAILLVALIGLVSASTMPKKQLGASMFNPVRMVMKSNYETKETSIVDSSTETQQLKNDQYSLVSSSSTNMTGTMPLAAAFNVADKLSSTPQNTTNTLNKDNASPGQNIGVEVEKSQTQESNSTSIPVKTVITSNDRNITRSDLSLSSQTQPTLNGTSSLNSTQQTENQVGVFRPLWNSVSKIGNIFESILNSFSFFGTPSKSTVIYESSPYKNQLSKESDSQIKSTIASNKSANKTKDDSEEKASSETSQSESEQEENKHPAEKANIFSIPFGLLSRLNPPEFGFSDGADDKWFSHSSDSWMEDPFGDSFFNDNEEYENKLWEEDQSQGDSVSSPVQKHSFSSSQTHISDNGHHLYSKKAVVGDQGQTKVIEDVEKEWDENEGKEQKEEVNQQKEDGGDEEDHHEEGQDSLEDQDDQEEQQVEDHQDTEDTQEEEDQDEYSSGNTGDEDEDQDEDEHEDENENDEEEEESAEWGQEKDDEDNQSEDKIDQEDYSEQDESDEDQDQQDNGHSDSQQNTQDEDDAQKQSSSQSNEKYQQKSDESSQQQTTQDQSQAEQTISSSSANSFSSETNGNTKQQSDQTSDSVETANSTIEATEKSQKKGQANENVKQTTDSSENSQH